MHTFEECITQDFVYDKHLFRIYYVQGTVRVQVNRWHTQMG